MKLRRLLSVLLTLALLACLLSAAAMPAAAAEVGDWTELQTALSAGGNVTLTGDITWPEDSNAMLQIPENTAVTLDLNGHTIDCTCTDGSDTVPASVGFQVLGSLTIEDSAQSGTGLICGAHYGILVNGGSLDICSGTITAAGDYCFGIFATEGASFNMSGGEISGVAYGGVLIMGEDTTACLSGGTLWGNAHGVYVSGGASLILSGTEIIENDGYGIVLSESSCRMDGGIVSGNGNGYLDPDAEFANVYATQGSAFVLNGGEISDSGMNGIIVQDSTATLSGGSIFYNAWDGVFIEGGTVTMTDCDIYENGYDAFYVYLDGALTISGGDLHDNDEYGVYINAGEVTLESGDIRDNGIAGVRIKGGGSFTMNGGTVSGNAEDGVQIIEDSSFELSGGTISDSGFYGVFVGEGEFRLSGVPAFSGNGADIGLNDGAGVTFADALMNTQPVRVAAVTLSADAEDVTIYYTTDGSDPTEDSTQYTVPITVSGANTLKAIAVGEGTTDGEIVNVEYTISAIYPEPVTEPVSSVQTITIPVSGDEETVNVTVEVKDDTATVTGADVDKVLKAEEVGTVTIDVSSLSGNITEVVIPNELLTKIADAAADESNTADGMEVKLPGGTVSFDARALEAITEQANGQDLKINLDSIGKQGLNAAQQAAVSDMEVGAVLDAYMTSGGKRISDFNGGKATLSVPYALKEGQQPAGIVVYYVADDGSVTKMNAWYANGVVSFEVPHFSNYVIAYDAKQAAACPQDSTCPMSAFTDLDPTAWYHDGIHFCLANGLMDGIGTGVFKPGAATSRAMIVKILYRLENEPKVTEKNPFVDVEAGKWFTDAVIWAAENKIVDGYDSGEFKPLNDVTREELATILYRYAQYKGGGFTGMWYFLLDYPDANEISSWADEAMHWCVMNEIINGKNDKLVPGGIASRAEAATMLMRYCSMIAE